MFTLLDAIPLIWRLVGVLSLVGAIGGSATWYTMHERTIGYNKCVIDVAAKNKEATDAVNKATSQVDACNFIHGTWDTSAGVCRQ